MAHWGYGKGNGPHTWGDHWPIAKEPKHGQSPIDIESENVTKPEDWKRIKLKFRPERCTKIHNNGHSFQVDVAPPTEEDGERGYTLKYGPLTEDFALAQFHFHWGVDDSEGSEHTVDGKSYAAEAHFVHYNMTKYRDVNEAIDKQGGLAVLGVLLEVGRENKGIQRLLEHFERIPYKGDVVHLQGFNPKCLLPSRKHRQKYWHYYGSLTTPPLHESVNWFVFQKPLQISSEQLDAFRALHSHARRGSPDRHDEFDGFIRCNFRPPQPRNFETKDEDGEDMEFERTLYSEKKKSRPKKDQDTNYNEEDSGEDAASDSCSSSSSSEEEDDE